MYASVANTMITQVVSRGYSPLLLPQAYLSILFLPLQLFRHVETSRLVNTKLFLYTIST